MKTSATEPNRTHKPEPRRRIAIFGVKYSSNLGDGVIAECLASEIERAEPSIEIVPIDLAGRQGFDPTSGRGRRRLLAVLEAMPKPVRRRVVPLMLQVMVRTRIMPTWKDKIETCEGAIIGGGALIADADQNFPIKLQAAMNLCAERRIPVALAHVGVSSDWSRSGRERLLRGFASAEMVATTFRDPVSSKLFATLFDFDDAPLPLVASDPGLLASCVYGDVVRESRVSRKVGICITNAMILRLHGEGRNDALFLREWFQACIRALIEDGSEVVLFTNGSPEDEEEKTEIARSFRNVSKVSSAERFVVPADLSQFIGGLDGVIAHRLHACIVAYSYSVPALGLSWDRKLNHFFAMVGMEKNVIDPHGTSPFEAARMFRAAVETPVEAQSHQKILDDCRKGIAGLAATFLDSAARERVS